MGRRTVQSGFLILLASLAICATGCITFTVDTSLNRDGSGTRTVETVLDRSLSDVIKLSGADAAAGFERQLRDSLPANATLRNFVRDGQTHYVARFSFASIADLNRINLGRSRRTGRGAPAAALRASSKFLFTDYDFQETLPRLDQPLTPQESSLVQNFTVVYRLTMPGAITSSNASRLQGSSTGVWNVPVATGASVRASSRVINWLPVAGTLLGLAAVVAATIVLVIALRRRGGEKGPAQAGVES